MHRFVIRSLWAILALTCLCLSGCELSNPASEQKPLKLPPGLSIEEHALKGMPQIVGESTLSFAPIYGTQEEVLSKHQEERNKPLPDASFYENFRSGFSATWNGQKITAIEYETPAVTTDKGTFYKISIQVSQGEKMLYTVQAGDSGPTQALRGLWAYDNHWVLEVAHASQKFGLPNMMDYDVWGEAIQDGISLNKQNGYQEVFGFQPMKGRPFYFFNKGGKLGISYNGAEILLGYTQVPHYQCCSASANNPKSAENMVSFFARRGGNWYYVEIGVFE
jgi:hypothetical protein